MKIVSGMYIKHVKFMDVCVEVKKVYDYGHGLKISGVWWNLGQKTSYRIGYKCKFNIGKNTIDDKRLTRLEDWVRVELRGL